MTRKESYRKCAANYYQGKLDSSKLLLLTSQFLPRKGSWALLVNQNG